MKPPIAWDEMEGEGGPVALERVGRAARGPRGVPLAQNKRGWDPRGPGRVGGDPHSP